MDRIKIFFADGVRSLTMPRCKPKLVPVDESIVTKMASGKMVEDLRVNAGYRLNIEAEYGQISAQDMIFLQQIIRENGFHRVIAPGIGEDIDQMYKVMPVSPTVFTYKKGKPVWHNITLRLIAQEVTKK